MHLILQRSEHILSCQTIDITLTAKKSKWTPPEGQFASIDYFIKKCRHDVLKLKSNCNTKLSNLSKEEWTALINLKNRNDLVIKAADKGGTTVVWRTDLYQQEAIRQLSDPTFYTKVRETLLTPREHRKPQKSRTKINFSTGYTLSPRNQ